jgi:hypothetical protein
MKTIKILLSVFLIFACAAVTIACSNGNSPVEPPTDDTSGISNDLPISFGSEVENNRSVLAVYDAVIDPVAKTFSISPSERIAGFHYPLTQVSPNVLQIVGYGFTPNFWADIKLTHPYAGSGIDAFDPRVIAILPANPGVSFIYPTLNAIGNNKVVIDPDGYTKLFDNLGGSIPGNTNPFKAYFTDQPNRIWSSTGVTSENRHWDMNLSGFAGPLNFKLVVDVSTNYPNPPAPVTDNAKEPVKIDVYYEEGNLYSNGGSANLHVSIMDWQGESGISDVKVESPLLFNGTIDLLYWNDSLDPNEYLYWGIITNEKSAPAGEYKYLIAAKDSATGIYLYREFPITVHQYYDEGNLIWAKRAGGAGGFDGADIARDVTTLSFDSVAATGYFWGTTSIFGEGEPNETRLTSFGLSDVFVAQYNPDGTVKWAKNAGGPDADYAFGITALSDDSTVVVGHFKDGAVFGLGDANQTQLIATGGYNDNDIFIARYNSNGSLAWAKSAGGTEIDDNAYAVTTLSDDSIVVTGTFELSATFGQGEPNQTVLLSDGFDDIFIARYNPDGTLIWAKSAGGTDYDWGYAITTLAESNSSTVITGSFRDTCTFGRGEVNETVLVSSTGGIEDIFVARYNPDGTLAWAKSAGGSHIDRGYGITAYYDLTVVVGHFCGEATFGLNEINQTLLTAAGGEYDADIFIAQYDPYGSLNWVRKAGSMEFDTGQDISILYYGSSFSSTFVTGGFRGSATFGAGEPNETVLTSAGDRDIFVAEYNAIGNLLWAKRAGSSRDVAMGDYGYGITTLANDSAVVVGDFMDVATFGEGEPNETTLTTAGGMNDYDMFIARYASDVY